mmetsp:Transcript_47238/g.115384  ORF Transcript_47238/g.115384 Transcript_47238/m.115384 type:complete len:93 (-) Transcript_47238:144-422(-)
MLREGIFPRDVSPNLRSKKDTVLPTVSGPGGKSSMNESFAPVDERGPIHTKGTSLQIRTVFKDKIKIVRRILRSVWVAMLLTMEDRLSWNVT